MPGGVFIHVCAPLITAMSLNSHQEVLLLTPSGRRGNGGLDAKKPTQASSWKVSLGRIQMPHSQPLLLALNQGGFMGNGNQTQAAQRLEGERTVFA